MNKAVFLDRDGTLLEDIDYNCRFQEEIVFPFTVKALEKLRLGGFLLVLASNQSAVARGICSPTQVENFHREMQDFFLARGVYLDALYYSPYHPEGTVPEFSRRDKSRKPEPGMLHRAADNLDIDLSVSYMIGDQHSDLSAAKAAGCTPILVMTGKGRRTLAELQAAGEKGFLRAPDLLQAAELILSRR